MEANAPGDAAQAAATKGGNESDIFTLFMRDGGFIS